MSDKEQRLEGFDRDIAKLFEGQQQLIWRQKDVASLLQLEARLTKRLYKYAAAVCEHGYFLRDRTAGDRANKFLNHGNYLTYGLAATTTWVLGILHGFAVMHGKNRRGVLVFDVADLIKDALVLPLAFICAKEKISEQEFRQQVLEMFTRHKALEYMFFEVKQAALRTDWSDVHCRTGSLEMLKFKRPFGNSSQCLNCIY